MSKPDLSLYLPPSEAAQILRGWARAIETSPPPEPATAAVRVDLAVRWLDGRYYEAWIKMREGE